MECEVSVAWSTGKWDDRVTITLLVSDLMLKAGLPLRRSDAMLVNRSRSFPLTDD